MLTIEPTGAILGATIRGIDLAQPIPEPDFGRILLALGQAVRLGSGDGAFLGRLQADRHHRGGVGGHGRDKGNNRSSGGEMQFHVSLS